MANRDYYNKRKAALELERESFVAHWKELSQFVLPRRGRFFTSERNKGSKKHQSIINSEGTQALKTATSGMLAGTMSPSRPWFSLEPFDDELLERQDVKEYLWKVEAVLRRILNESNFYGMASSLLSELLLFGTGAMFHVDDFNDVARFYTQTVGSYNIATNERGRVDTILREWEWPALTMVKEFGLENVSAEVKRAVDRGNYSSWFKVAHLVEPNDDFAFDSPMATDKPFRSVYWEPGHDNVNKNKLLHMSGFDEFPVYVPRWETAGSDIYGTDCPGMTALGDIKGLQIEEKRKAQGIDKQMNPPLVGPPQVRNTPVNSLPGGLTLHDDGGSNFRLGPLYEVRPQIGELRLDIEAVERRIQKAFFVDLFLAISTMEGIQPRNQLDLTQRNEERLLQLGPVLERLHGEFLSPLVDRIFNQAVNADILPDPPESLSGSPLKVRFISTLAMAQRAVATQSIDRLAMFTGNLVQLGFPEAAMKFDAQQAVDEYAEAIGVSPKIVVPDDVVQAKMAEQRQRQEVMEAAEVGVQASQAVKNVAGAVNE